MTIFLLLAAASGIFGSPKPGGDNAAITDADQASRAPAAELTDFFESHIRPILAEHCFRCHGPQKQESGLRLDSRPALLKGNDAGPVVVAGQPEESPLIAAIRHDSPVKMPPEEKLPPQAIADLTEWVKLGVPWPESLWAKARSGAGEPTISGKARKHWAFQPVSDKAVPPVKNAGWARNSIDRFIMAQLEAKGLTPSPPASMRTLIRRTTFDLIGLPPTPAEVAAFENDPAPDAYDRLIERLLASPHYGERWGRYWLDVARYADTKGYVLFEDADFHWAYTYRDYVVSAFNRDLAYDQFLVEQIAADRLPANAVRQPLAALGFLTLGNRFIGNFHDVIDDRIDVICRGLMSLTVGCARCHDHKFDPIPTQDYYSLYGVLASARAPLIPPEASQSPQTPAYANFVRELESRRKKLDEFVATKQHELIESTKRRIAEYLLAAQRAIDQPSAEDFMLIADGTDLNPVILIRWQSYLPRTRTARDPVFAPWHALAVLPVDGFLSSARLVLTRLAEDESRQSISPVAPRGKRQPANPVVLRALMTEAPNSLADVARIYAKLICNVDQLWKDLKRRAALDRRTPGALPDASLEALRLVLYGPDSPLDFAVGGFGDLALFPDRPSQAKLRELREALQKWLTNGPGAPPRVISVEDLPAPVEPRVFLRGNPNNPGERVPRQFLAVLSGSRRKPFRNGSGRLELARAIASRDNPLTARSLVNRVWMHHFGTPLVATPGDFGLRSDPSKIPDLLDHLAARFVEQGWSIKALHRLIMLSNTYQQQSDDRPQARAIDPDNIYYWRMNRRRLEFEALRDSLLAVSGKLDHTIGGPPLHGAVDNAANRRTIYCFIDRLNLPGLYRTFDFPDPNATNPRRDQTTVAPQALFLMNHPFILDLPGVLLALPKISAASDADEKIDRLLRVIYGRPAAADDRGLAHTFLGDAPDRSARWPLLVHALLMANEFLFID
jgi:hypothetical protein